ncbi:MAG: quinone-dependent dihydroorotate dehydrogenase [Candidatus Woesearchaeota archaeon]
MYKKIIRPILFRSNPEVMHERMLGLGERLLHHSYLMRWIDSTYAVRDSRLEVECMGLKFPNPVGLAAGFDKNGVLIDFLPHLGFGYMEVGSVTAEGGTGNPKPRIFRLVEDEAIINRMGLNNEGAEKIYERLKGKEHQFPVGINIAKTHDPNIMGDAAIRDFCKSYRIMHPVADYLTLNISCPNTKEGKTFEDPAVLGELLSALRGEEGDLGVRPMLLKLSPDLDYLSLDNLLGVGEGYRITGYVISNTTKNQVELRISQYQLEGIGVGGVSGVPVQFRARELTRYVRDHLPETTIISVGGINSPHEALKRFSAGADLIQVYTGLIYEGPELVRRINRALLKYSTQKPHPKILN